MSDHAHAAAPPASGDALRKAFIVALLVGGMIALHRFATPTGGFDPTGMLALGFVILASYTFGQLVGVIKLPEITGYMLAGILLGPSVAGFLPEAWREGPLAEGILNKAIIGQLRLLDTLAISLIALTAGGELQFEALRKSIRAIGGFLGGMIAIGLPVLTACVFAAVSLGALPMPGFEGASLVALSGVVSVVLLATSPAATIAVVTSTGAKGPRTQLVMATVIFMDVVMATLFSVGVALAASLLGGHAAEGSVAAQLFVHIGGSLGFGALVGFLTILYLRYVGAELLLFVVSLVYLVAFANASLHLDNILVFIAAGFTVSNLSKEGDTLIHAVEQLSLPTYVVFFTLAGAGLDLQVLASMAPIAVGLALVRMGVFWAGMNAGGRLAGVDPAVRDHGWMGMVSQAGVALGLAALIGTNYGESGKLAQTLIISVISINQLLGPVLLKVALGWLGELPSGPKADDAAIPSSDSHELPREPTDEVDPWGPPPSSGAVAPDQAARELESHLREIVDDLARPFETVRADADAWLRELRREFLRHNRLAVEHSHGPADLSWELRQEQKALANAWRALVLERAKRCEQALWAPRELIDAIDAQVEALPERLQAPWPDEAFVAVPGEGRWTRARRVWLRLARLVRRPFGLGLPLREVPLRNLARYHLSGELPLAAERIVAVFVNAEAELADRTRSLFQSIVDGYDAVAAMEGADPALIEERLRQVRRDVEDHFAHASSELDRIVLEARARATRVVGGATWRLKQDLRRIGTPDLPGVQRRFGRVYKARTRGLELLDRGLQDARTTTSQQYSLVALELELFRLESGIKEAVEAHGEQLAARLRESGAAQLARVDAALERALALLEDDLASDRNGEVMARSLRRETSGLAPIVSAAGDAAASLCHRLADEQALGGLLDALLREAGELTERYVVPVQKPNFDEWTLPRPTPVVEVPFREVATTYIEMSATRDLLQLSRSLSDDVQRAAFALEELERLIGFNVELANAELDVLQGEPVPQETRDIVRDMVIAPLRRSRSRLAALMTEAEAWPQRAAEGVRRAVLDDLQALRRQVVEGKVSELRLRLLREVEVGRWLVREAGNFGTLATRARTRADKFLQTAVGADRLELLRVRLGLPAEVEGVDAEAFVAPSPPIELPIVYRRLFSDQAVEAGQLVTGRTEDVARARRALERGPVRAVAIVGVQGVGKGAVVRAAAHDFEGGVTRITLAGPTDAEEVAFWFENAEPGRLHIVDGLQWMFSLRPNGYDPLRRFCDGVVAEAGRTAWLVTAEASVWSCAIQGAPLEQAFPNVLKLAPLGPEELATAVLARHAMTGFGVSFEAEEDLGWQVRFLLARRGDREQRYQDAWFRTLHAATGGLVHDALRLWTASIRSVDEEAGVIKVGPVRRPSMAALQRLPEDALLTLRLVLRQGWMTAELHAELFRGDVGTSRAHLLRLGHWGLLEQVDGTWRVVPHLEGPLHRTLEELQWA